MFSLLRGVCVSGERNKNKEGVSGGGWFTMWVFYALAGPIALGMVVATLQYFAASTVPLHVRWIVGYAWFCTISIIILVPADIWTVRIPSIPSPLFLACPCIHLCKQTLSSTPTSPFYSSDFSKVQS